jgi:hypothetical protein
MLKFWSIWICLLSFSLWILDQINHSDEDVIWTQRIITAVLLLLQVSFSNDFLQFMSMHLSLVILHFLLFFSLWYILLCLIGSEIEYECMGNIQFSIGELRISELILMKCVIRSCNKCAIAWLQGEFWKARLLEAIEKVGPFMMPHCIFHGHVVERYWRFYQLLNGILLYESTSHFSKLVVCPLLCS